MSALESPPPRGLLAAAELALTALTLVAVAGFARLFLDGAALGDVALAAVAAHGVAVLLRRTGVPFGWSLALSFGAGVLVASWLLYPDTLAAVLPTRETAARAADDLGQGWQEFGRVVAPVEVDPGFTLAAVLGVWLAATAADAAAFRTPSLLVPVVPASSLYLAGALLARGRESVVVTAAFLATALVFLLLQRQLTWSTVRRWRWLAADRNRGTGAALRVGLALAAGALAVGVLAGPRLPGVGSEALVDWRPGDGSGGTRTTVSPLVDLRARLEEQSDQLVFTVEADQRAYWRTTALDEFDGLTWTSSGAYTTADGELEGAADAEGVEVEQTFDVQALGEIWLPAAYRATRVEPVNAPVRFDEESATLIVDDELATSDGVRYEVRSVLPTLDATQLAGAADPPPTEVRRAHLGLPDDFSEEAVRLAEEATAGATTPYDQALALQRFFRDGFRYSLELGPAGGGDPIERFLEDRVGFCQQFAGTYAAMARSIGLPSRVAVGYTPGEADPDQPGRYLVRGRHAHAWPEVYLAGVGWVPFEPTPGRGMPGAEAWTGVAEQQDGGVPAEPATTTTAAPPTSAGGTTPTSAPAEVPPSAAAAPADDGGFRLPLLAVAGTVAVALAVLLGVALVALAWLLVVPALLRRRRARALAVADPSRRALAAWDQALADLVVAGLDRTPSDTPEEAAERAATLGVTDGALPRRLGATATRARYAPEGVDEVAAADAVADADAIHRAVERRLTPRRRWWRRLDPRPLLRR